MPIAIVMKRKMRAVVGTATGAMMKTKTRTRKMTRMRTRKMTRTRTQTVARRKKERGREKGGPTKMRSRMTTMVILILSQQYHQYRNPTYAPPHIIPLIIGHQRKKDPLYLPSNYVLGPKRVNGNRENHTIRCLKLINSFIRSAYPCIHTHRL